MGWYDAGKGMSEEYKRRLLQLSKRDVWAEAASKARRDEIARENAEAKAAAEQLVLGHVVEGVDAVFDGQQLFIDVIELSGGLRLEYSVETSGWNVEYAQALSVRGLAGDGQDIVMGYD